MKRSALQIIAVLLTLAMQPGCATITTGTDQVLTVTTEMGVEGAECTLVDTKNSRHVIAETPGAVEVSKGDGPMTITCEKEGYKTTTIEIEESVQGATFGNVILGGGIGIIFDAASGAAQRYPDEVTIWMEPREFASEEKKQEWLDARKSYEDQLQAEKDALTASDYDEYDFH